MDKIKVVRWESEGLINVVELVSSSAAFLVLAFPSRMLRTRAGVVGGPHNHATSQWLRLEIFSQLHLLHARQCLIRFNKESLLSCRCVAKEMDTRAITRSVSL